MLMRRLVVGSLTLAVVFQAGCSFACAAVLCGDALHVTVSNAAKAFDASPTPTVSVCVVGETCTTFHLTKENATMECKADSSLTQADVVNGVGCFFDGDGQLSLTARGGEEDELEVTIEVRTPEGAVAFTAERTVENAEGETCGGTCHDATAAFAIPG